MKFLLAGTAAALTAALASATVPVRDYPASYFEPGVVFAPAQGPRDESRPFVRMAVTPFARPNAMFPIVDATIAELRKVFGAGNFEARLFSGDPEDFGDAALVLSSAGTYMRTQGKGARDLATAVSDLTPDPGRGEGSLFITLRSRDDISRFGDMKGKRVASTGPRAFSGLQCALGEIARRGEDPDRFFSERVYSGLDMTRELEMLRSGRVDVAIVRTCLLEELERGGTDVSDIKPVAARQGVHPAGCLASTDLYPNWTIIATPLLSPELATRATLALLAMPAGENGVRWNVASDFSQGDALFRSIREGPYEYLRHWTVKRAWDEYREWILALILGVVGLFMHAVRSSHLVRVRTRELSAALAEQKAARRKAAEAQERMMALQRAGATGQMSSIIAHELRQPLSAISGYAQGIERLADRPATPVMEKIGRGAGMIRRHAMEAEAVVRKVREYARGKGSRRTAVDASEVVGAAVATVRNAGIARAEISCSLDRNGLVILADPMEIELAVQNLIRNALQALEGRKDGRVLAATSAGTGAGGRAAVVISVTDNGRPLSREEFSRLSGILQSSKTEGLGLGLSIVRLIAENHGGHLEFLQVPGGGIRASIILPLCGDVKGDPGRAPG